MHGIPGFETEGQPVVERSPLTTTDAIRIAFDSWGLDVATAERLDTERDDTFALDTLDDRFVLKVAHPADSARELDFQTSVLGVANAADPTLPLQRLLPSIAGPVALSLPEQRGRIARVFDWLPGDLLQHHRPDTAQLRALGGTLGRLTRALADFEHPASERPFAWDLAQFSRLDTLVTRYPSPEVREVLRRFHASIEPRLAELPRQVIHNDFNPGNVLVDPADPQFVVGILDFGDAIRTIRVADVAVGLSYQLFPFGRGWSLVQPFLEAYDQEVGLTALEHEVVRDLVLCRLAQRVLINRWLSETDAGAGDDHYRSGLFDTLTQLLEES